MARVLIVAERNVLSQVVSPLQKEGHEVSACAHTDEAATRLHQFHADIVCADFSAPGLGGLIFLRGLAQQGQAGRVLFATYDEYAKNVSLKTDRFHLVIKPFQEHQLLRTIGQAWNIIQVARKCRPTGKAVT